MRLRVKRAVPVPEAQMPLPFAGRLRVRAKQLTLPEPEFDSLCLLEKRDWTSDLDAVQRGLLPFATLAKRHRPLIRTMIRSWAARCPTAFGGPEDLIQEVLLEIWMAIEKWEPNRAPLKHFVRIAVHNRLRSLIHKHKKRAERDGRFLTLQIVEEKVVVMHDRASLRSYCDDSAAPASYEAVVPPETLEQFDAARVAARVVGGLPSKQARVVVGIVLGESADSVTSRVYGSRCMRPRKAALRAFAAAQALVESTSAVGADADHQRTEHVSHESTATFPKDSCAGFQATRQEGGADAGYRQ